MSGSITSRGPGPLHLSLFSNSVGDERGKRSPGNSGKLFLKQRNGFRIFHHVLLRVSWFVHVKDFTFWNLPYRTDRLRDYRRHVQEGVGVHRLRRDVTPCHLGRPSLPNTRWTSVSARPTRSQLWRLEGLPQVIRGGPHMEKPTVPVIVSQWNLLWSRWQLPSGSLGESPAHVTD